MEKVKKKIDFTEGGVFFKILLFVLPIVATNLLQTFYNAADMMVVSLSHEKNAVGAIGTTNAFVNLIVNVFIGFSVGANVVVARAIGSRNEERTQKAVHTSLIMGVIFGVLGMGIGLGVSRPVLKAMGNSGNLLDLAVTYTDIYFVGVPFLALTNYLIAIFRAKGDAKTPLIVLTLTGLLNVGLNFFFVMAVGMSVEGVALATSISNAASVVILLVRLKASKDATAFSWKALRLDKESFKDIAVNGLPAGIQGGLFSLSNMLIQSSVVKMNGILVPDGVESAPVVNGNAAAQNLESFIYTAMNAVYQGAITFTSQNLGAKKPHRVRRILYSCFTIVCIIGVSLSLLVFGLREPFLRLYGVKKGLEGVDGLAYQTAVTRFEYICLPYFLCGMMDVCTGVLRGLGRSLLSTVISLVGACLMRLVWLWTVFKKYTTLRVIYVSYPISWILTTLAAYVMILVIVRKLLREENA